MFENLLNFFKKKNKNEDAKSNKDTAKERLHLVLMQDRANVSADFLEMIIVMEQLELQLYMQIFQLRK